MVTIELNKMLDNVKLPETSIVKSWIIYTTGHKIDLDINARWQIVRCIYSRRKHTTIFLMFVKLAAILIMKI